MSYRVALGVVLSLLFLAPRVEADPDGSKAVSAGENQAAESRPAQDAPDAASELPLKEIEDAYAGTTPPESVRMLLGIARGSMLGPGSGWYGPADARYSWKWLAETHGVPESGSIPADQFNGTERWFARLDRNEDGRIARDDLDWSERSPWVRQASLTDYLFANLGAGGDGKLSREELTAFFDAAAGGKDHLLPDDFRRALMGGYATTMAPGDAPSRAMLIRGLFAGDFGSLNEGPGLNERAPDFSLKTHDGTKTVRLADLLGDKPVVLTFGNFTCGPFRYMFPGVEAVHARFADEATFVAVYVREAHPTDGWVMESNARAGVAVTQPQTYAERKAVATKCAELLRPAMPLLVDEINDPVGHAYSGMPARLYVIDRDGNVAYKGGRGPFGFKAGEMEQALVMTLLDQKGGPKITPDPAQVEAENPPQASAQLGQWLTDDADLAAAAAKWPGADEQRVGELRRLKGHSVATAVLKGNDPASVWLHRDGLPDVPLSGDLPGDPSALPPEWVDLLKQGDLVIDMTTLPETVDLSVWRQAATAAAASLRRAVPGAKVILARTSNWRENVRRLWSEGPLPVGVVVQPDDMGRGLGAIHMEIARIFGSFRKLDGAGRFGAVVTEASKPQAFADYAAEVRTSQTINGVPVRGRQWLVIACGEGGASAQQVAELAAALEAAGAAQVITHDSPINGLAAAAAIGELFGRLESASANPVELWPEWVRSQRDARQGLSEIQLPPDIPEKATNLLKDALGQLKEP
jgi:hypothetical protein